MKVVYLKALPKERGLRGHSKLRKAELITFLQNNLQPSTSTPRPDTRTRSQALNPRTRPPRPTRPSPPPLQLVRFRPDRPRQPELLRQLEERPVKSTTFKPYQLTPKRGKETFIEPPVEQPPVEQSSSNQNQIKRMKKIKAVTSCSTHKIDQQETDG